MVLDHTEQHLKHLKEDVLFPKIMKEKARKVF
jgi:hypothetical protein